MSPFHVDGVCSIADMKRNRVTEIRSTYCIFVQIEHMQQQIKVPIQLTLSFYKATTL